MVDGKNNDEESSKRPLSEIKKDQYKKENYTQVAFRTRNKRANELLGEVAGRHGKSKSEYVRDVLNMALQEEGYKKEDFL